MKKLFFGVVFTFILITLHTKESFASLLVINKDGIITWNVLSDADVTLDIPRHSYIEVRTLDESEKEAASQVSLKKDENKISLVVSSDQKERVLDVTNWDEDLVEVEERPETQKVKIGIKEGIFSITQKGIVALTEFPIIIDSKTAQLSVETPTGNRYLSIFPYDAVEAVLRAKFISRISDNEIEIKEEDRELQYKISGDKVFNLFDLYEHAVPVSFYVSASTGEILSIDAPGWLKMVGFLFT